jgi:hypothetical protein
MAAPPNSEPRLIQPLNPMQPPPPPATPPLLKAGETQDVPQTAKPDGADKPENQAKPENPNASEKDPMRELLDRVARFAPMVASTDPALARTLQALSQRGADPDQRTQPGFRHDVAYALQDLEKSPAGPGRLELPAALRSEMTQLANTAVGLTNERMQALMQTTAAIGDRSIVNDMRELAKDIGRYADQNTQAIDSRIDVAENKSRLGPRAPTQRPTPQSPSQDPGNEARAPTAPLDDHGGPGSGPSAPPPGASLNGNRNGDSYQSRNTSQGEVTTQHSVLDTLLRAMRPDLRAKQPPWEPPATPVADRLAASEQRTQMDADDREFAAAAQRGKSALDALQGFTNGEGATIMSKIREAAKTEPGGMPQVLSEMREGGRFADLRKQFANALADDAGFASAYEKAAGALAAYGKTRADIEPILARRPDAVAFTQRLGDLVAEIGQAAAWTPGKSDGRSMMDELAKQAAELLQRAVEAVKLAFSRSPEPSASSSPSPSP